MTYANELPEFLMFLLIIGSIVGWIIIGIGILKYRIEGRCPKGRMCKNSECRWSAWCEKHQRYSDKYKYLSEKLREMKKEKKQKRVENS